MVKRILSSLLMAVMVLSVSAQKITVSGRVVETSGEPIDQATVQILQLPDSTYVNGCVSIQRVISLCLLSRLVNMQ